jgi:hypothetical protein
MTHMEVANFGVLKEADSGVEDKRMYCVSHSFCIYTAGTPYKIASLVAMVVG